MMKLDANKLKGLKSFDSYLNEQYGEENSVERKEFEAKAKAPFMRLESSSFMAEAM